jgi:hypothetical protein
VAEYRRHEPEKTLLHEAVREQLEGFLARSSSREQPAPRFIEQELRAFDEATDKGFRIFRKHTRHVVPTILPDAT